MRPQRISSEAPEVVPQQTDLYISNSQSHLDRFKRKKGTQYEKQLADRQSPGVNGSPPTAFDLPGSGGGYETPASVNSPRGPDREYQTPTPGTLYDISPYEAPIAVEKSCHGQRVCGLVTTIVLVVVAFIVGGGVGGGIGGAIAVKDKSRYAFLLPVLVPSQLWTPLT